MAGGGTSKIVDYAIVYVPDHETDKRIIAKLKSRFEHIINHIKAVCVRYKPIAISIETKRPRMDEDGAKVQLGIWAAAYIARLAELCDGGREGLPPFLPQIVVQGYDWRLKIASANGPAEAILHGDLAIGDTALVGDFHTFETARAFVGVGRKRICAVVC